MPNYAYHTNDPNAQLCYVHYLDREWYEKNVSGGRAIFGSPDVPHDDGCYNDRVDRDRWDSACTGEQVRTANDWSALWSRYLGYPVQITCILAGVRRFDGYPWFYYQWKKVTP
jgi:hypothetical protein